MIYAVFDFAVSSIFYYSSHFVKDFVCCFNYFLAHFRKDIVAKTKFYAVVVFP